MSKVSRWSGWGHILPLYIPATERSTSTGGLLLIAAGWCEPPATVPVAAPPVAEGQARIWFYRPYEPSESLNLANSNLNGNLFGAVSNGSACYRDVPPGHYRIAPESFGDINQDEDADLAPGQQLYVRIVSLESSGVSVSGSKKFARDTLYSWLIPPYVAQVEIARNRSGI
jgi:Protein of unknown function (DUF2846)